MSFVAANSLLVVSNARSLPSTERMVVMARGKKSDSGSTEFAIMLHDNSAYLVVA